MMNKILAGDDLNTMSFLTIHFFRKYESLFTNQQNAIASFKPFECIGCL